MAYPNNKRRRKRWPQHVVPGRRGGGRCDRPSRSRRYQEGGTAADTAFADPPPTAAAAPPAQTSAPPTSGWGQTLSDLGDWTAQTPLVHGFYQTPMGRTLLPLMSEQQKQLIGDPTPSMLETKKVHPYLTAGAEGVGPFGGAIDWPGTASTVAQALGRGLRRSWRGQ